MLGIYILYINGYYSNGSFSGTIFLISIYIYTMNMYNEGLSWVIYIWLIIYIYIYIHSKNDDKPVDLLWIYRNTKIPQAPGHTFPHLFRDGMGCWID